MQYLENNDYYITGFSEKTIIVETEKYLKLSKKLASFGLIKFNNKLHPDAYITQESIEKEKSNKKNKIK